MIFGHHSLAVGQQLNNLQPQGACQPTGQGVILMFQGGCLCMRRVTTEANMPAFPSESMHC